jgi:cbb3-type cytochrome c oxidase subunit II
MIRPFRHETERYGEYSKAGEFVYDHPFQWGSKRTGPDLQREGGRNPIHGISNICMNHHGLPLDLLCHPIHGCFMTILT